MLRSKGQGQEGQVKARLCSGGHLQEAKATSPQVGSRIPVWLAGCCVLAASRACHDEDASSTLASISSSRQVQGSPTEHPEAVFAGGP